MLGMCGRKNFKCQLKRNTHPSMGIIFS